MGVTIKVVRKGDGAGFLSRIVRAIRGPKKVKVGYPGSAGGDVVMKAFYNEFGTKGSGKGFKTPRGGGFGGPIPERPFMRLAMKKGQPEFRRVAIGAAKEIIAGRLDMRGALAKLGTEGVEQVKDSISDLSSPPNSPVTVAIKGSNKPLIDTSDMRNRTQWEIDR
ncbi:MAG: hypothetical protein M9939_26645 [Mesorhizobium sp.]|nr:hypothetical protein [Mesorhizobium sp.]MCO5085150.1 hypothetical protein [Rhizobiaceae bacterium]MCO5164673.1 hypothetical protein [Mesorhizobium sp.]